MSTKNEQTGSQMRITPTELGILKNTFKGQEELVRLMRKLFLPELDPFVPLGQNIDLWMTVKIDSMPPEEAIINIKARNALIQHLDQVLMSIKTLAETADETPEEAVERMKKDSTKQHLASLNNGGVHDDTQSPINCSPQSLKRKTMDEESNDNIESINDETEEVFNTEEVEEITPEVETEDKSSELEEKNRKLFERAKKAEAEAREWKAKAQNTQAPQTPKPAESTPSEKQDGISAMDAMALMGAKVTEKEDIEEVVEYARFKGVPISEALKSSTVKTILAEKAEQRATSEATNTSSGRRGTTKPSVETILANASKGNLPENPDDLADAWIEAKKKSK